MRAPIVPVEVVTRPKRKQGFATMDPQVQRDIAILGGRRAHQKGVAHEFTPEEAREAGKKGAAARIARYGK